MLSPVYRAAIVIVVASAVVCLAQEGQVVAVERNESGDLIRQTTQSGVCNNSRCQPPANTYLVQDGECEQDTVLQRSKCSPSC